ncbi:hypothetical protein ExPUPEC79_03120 [Escherichia coli]|nr:hypothetical protein ExPUPEC79_03120 [Escherichia coli]
MGAKIYTDPIFEPVKVAQVLVSKAKATINTNGETPEPSTPATASPTIAVKPVPASASATPITPAIIKMTGAPI